MQTNWPNSGSIKIEIFWMSTFEFQSKFCNLSLVLEDRMHLALFKKIRIFYGLLHLVTYCYFSKLTWSSLNLVQIDAIPYYVASVMSPDFFQRCQMQPISQDQWKIAEFILEFKSTHPTGLVFDGIKIGWIFLAIKRSLTQCGKLPGSSKMQYYSLMQSAGRSI